MVKFQDPRDRPASNKACIYWNDTRCTANDFFSQEDISCFNEGLCDGFGTCRGCSKFDSGGLKVGIYDDLGTTTQTPLNLRVLNLRAKIQPCCHWIGEPVDFEKLSLKADFSTEFQDLEGGSRGTDAEGVATVAEATITVESTAGFEDNGRAYATKENDFSFSISYTSKTSTTLEGCSVSVDTSTDLAQEFPALAAEAFLGSGYEVFPVVLRSYPNFVPGDQDPDPDKGEVVTLCELSAAAPWQTRFTDDNPYPYGCNGAKPECPFYTGPKFTQAVDSKLTYGDRVSAKQILELRFFSDDWQSYPDPQEVYEQRFEEPVIWAWAADSTTGKGSFNSVGDPLIQKVYIEDLSADTPEFIVDPARSVTTGTPVQGQPPDYPTLVKDINSLNGGRLSIIWPNTSIENPLIKKAFTTDEGYIYVSAKVNSLRPVYAINLNKYPRDGSYSDEEFVENVKRTNPEDVIEPVVTGLPGSTFIVPLEPNSSVDSLNHIRIFLDSGSNDGSMHTADVWVRYIFHHAHIAQTSFDDFYGHTMVDPWVNHFTKIKINAQALNLTNNVRINDVLWNTIASNGKKTMYAIETQEELLIESDSSRISWEVLECGYIAVTFHDKTVNRVYPWKAWGTDSKDQDLYVIVDRSSNDDLEESESSEVELEFVFASTKGTAIPENVAIFKTPGDEAVSAYNKEKDKLRVRFAYTEYKQGPLTGEDQTRLKFAKDANDIIEAFPYGIEFDSKSGSIGIEGTFIRAGAEKLYSCDDIIGECFRTASLENEILARAVFADGGVDEDSIETHTQMINKCAEEFNSRFSGSGSKFDDGTSVSFQEASRRLKDIHLLEGSQQYTVVFEDNEGRPIGSKEVSFLTQSAVAQTRDVEIRYKWQSQINHYLLRDPLILLAIFAQPMYATTSFLATLAVEYDPFCGDHAETRSGSSVFSSFELGEDSHGALWYPYNSCNTPRYHADSTVFSNPFEYTSVVEGFGGDKRRKYWEKSRVFDKYMPATLYYHNLLGCFWSETDTNIHSFPPFTFTGYSKVRSSHPFGAYSSDRESLRLSRHWEKRNLNVSEETIKQESGGLSVELAQDFIDILYGDDGDLRSGSSLQTPVWVHMVDGLSVVRPATEEKVHPFTNLLLNRSGVHQFNEQFSEDRYPLNTIVEERDLTSSLDRSEDGSNIYTADGTSITFDEGIVVDEGTDIKWVFVDKLPGGSDGEKVAWAWVADPDEPIRSYGGGDRITGLFISNPSSALFKKDRTPATHTTEGEHTLNYSAPTFNELGEINSPATISMDGGPSLYISWTTEQVYILDGTSSPYDIELHEGEDYEFVMHGKGPDGLGVLADSRGLQRYEINGTKFATLAGVSINLEFTREDLPYQLVDVRFLDRDVVTTDIQESIRGVVKEYESNDNSTFSTGTLNFRGHYYVEKVVVEFLYGDGLDVPAINVTGTVFDSDATEGSNGAAFEYPVDEDPFDDEEALPEPLVGSTQVGRSEYQKGDGIPAGTSLSREFNIKEQLYSIDIDIGARLAGKGMLIQDIKVFVREPVDREEKIFTYEPKVQVSTGRTGTHRPSDLLFYFQRSYPEFSGGIVGGVKFTGRRVKDLIPHFEFTDTINNRFPYNNIDFDQIPGYV